MKERDRPGRAATFEELYAEHARRLEALLWLLGVAEAERGDVAQEMWFAVARGLKEYDPGRGSERAWLAGFARNAARDWHRTRRRRPELSTFTEEEPAVPGTADSDAERGELRKALDVFLMRAVPNEDQREAFVLHEVLGLTVEEVAKATGVRLWTAQWRLKMARGKVKKAQESLSEEERTRMRAVILPLGSVEALVEALRSSISDGEVQVVWERVTARLAAEGLRTDAPLGGGGGGGPIAPPGSHVLTNVQIASGLLGACVVGAVGGASVLYALLSRDAPSETPIVTEATPPTPPSAERSPEPVPSATGTAAPSSRGAQGVLVESEGALLDRARAALAHSAALALELSNRHAASFPRSNAGEREEIAVHALVSLGRREEAEARAAKLVRGSPLKRTAMEALLGRTLR